MFLIYFLNTCEKKIVRCYDRHTRSVSKGDFLKWGGKGRLQKAKNNMKIFSNVI